MAIRPYCNYCGAGILPAIDMIFTRCLVSKQKKRDRSDGRIRDRIAPLFHHQWGCKESVFEWRVSEAYRRYRFWVQSSSAWSE
jgi:hypothetical protein